MTTSVSPAAGVDGAPPRRSLGLAVLFTVLMAVTAVAAHPAALILSIGGEGCTGSCSAELWAAGASIAGFGPAAAALVAVIVLLVQALRARTRLFLIPLVGWIAALVLFAVGIGIVYDR